MRINRFLSQAGQGSRRGVEELVRAGRVRVNGEVVRDLGRQVDLEVDRVEVDGRAVEVRAPGRVLALHKPVGVVSTFVAQDERPTLRDLLGPQLQGGRLFHVGRLDHDSSGLLLLSDDGDLAHALMHPRHPVWKTYHIDVDPPLTEDEAATLREGGLPIDGRPAAPARVRALVRDGRRWEVQLREGRKRQLRRMVEAVGSRVVRLVRVAFGPVRLGDLPVGAVRALDAAEIAALREAAGLDTGRGDGDARR